MGSIFIKTITGVAASLVGGAAYFLNKKGVSFVNVAIDGSLYVNQFYMKLILMSFFSTNSTYDLAITCQKSRTRFFVGAGLLE